MRGKRILIGISGGISAYKICNLVRLFIKAGAEVKIIMTPSAAKFVSPLTLSVLSCNEVLINMFSECEFEKSEKVKSGTWHIDLGMWADAFLIAPATANTIAKITTGICDNLLLCTVLASRANIIIAPAMDADMLKNSITEQNINTLKNRGFFIIEPEFGELASGLEGQGRMAEPETIFNYVYNFVSKKSDLTGKRILVTAGPTIEYIDDVRFVTNHSSGKMGFAIAEAAFDKGAEVTLITGPVHIESKKGIKRINVRSSDDMFEEVKKNYSHKDYIIMSAAVEDFKPIKKPQKIKKEKLKNRFSIEFDKSADILKYLGNNKKGFKLVGFALETSGGIESAKKKLKEKNLDLIVLNILSNNSYPFGSDYNTVTLISRDGIKEYKQMSKYDIGNIIFDYLKE